MKSSACILCVALYLTPALSTAAVVEAPFGTTRDGDRVSLFTIANKPGASVAVMNYGAAVVSLKVPDRAGAMDDVVLGFDHLDGYLGRRAYIGAVVGRYGNRIGGAHFTLNGVEYSLPANDRGNTLHGGRHGFDCVVWKGAKVDDQTVEFTYLSKDGEEGFPGNLSVRVRYSLGDNNELKIEYAATTDRDTVVNLTNHSFFNLAGGGDNLGHVLQIDAEQITESGPTLIPTGKLIDVAGTPFDFREPHAIGERIEADDARLKSARGYDQNFVLTKKDGLRLAASVYEPTTGRVMEILTTEPGIQFYSGNGLDGSLVGKGGKPLARRSAFCLETQHFPDSPNHPEFPSTVLKAGETFSSTTVYRFSTR